MKLFSGKKNRGIAVLSAIFMTAALAMGCSSGSSSSDDDDDVPAGPVADSPEAGYVRINYKSKDSGLKLWIWNADSANPDYAPEEAAKCATWPDGIPLSGTSGEFKYANIKLNLDSEGNPTAKQIPFLVLKGDKKLCGDADIIFKFPQKYHQIYLKEGDDTCYVDSALTQVANGMMAATITDESVITVEFSGSPSLAKEMFKVTGNGSDIAVSSIGNLSSDKKLEVTVGTSLKSYSSVKVTYTDSSNLSDVVVATPSETLVDAWYGNADVSTFGYKNGKFVTWAPYATSVKAILFADQDAVTTKTEAATVDLVKGESGVWTSAECSATVGANKFYKYRIVNNDVTKDVADIWAKAASKESEASCISEIPSWAEEASYVNPFGRNGGDTKKYSDAVIYEMSVRDWSYAFNSATTTGKFNTLTSALAPAGEFAKHLKDLGITHVQILPCFEWAVYNKTKKDNTEYNWGYNPYNYNVPESRYVENDAVAEFRAMVKAFHDNGIAVIMDVVYNHTAGTKDGSLYDMTVPEYFYRVNNGVYSNGSGCGNEVATNHAIVKKFVIDSLKHWMKDYHINGFRFDLMGVHESSTMEDIYKELSQIDKNVMVYGEPWTGGTSAVVGGTTKAVNVAGKENGVGAFDDDFRDAVKGKEFGGFQLGQVVNAKSDSAIVKGLTGASSTRNNTGKPGLALHYIECHDNYTFADKLCYSNVSSVEYVCVGKDNIVSSFKAYDTFADDKKDVIRAENKLGAAFVFLSQGTPFINGGQEFMRTKKGNPDSYAADTKGGKTWSENEIVECNKVDLSFKTTYADVYNVYKGLIALRKANPDAFGSNTSATAETVSAGVTKYVTGNFLVYFNATSSDADITTTGYTKAVDVTSGAPVESSTLPAKVGAKSFVILKK